MTRATQKVELTIVAHVEADMITADNGVGHETTEPENLRLIAVEVGGLPVVLHSAAAKHTVTDLIEIEACDLADGDWEIEE